MPWSLVKVEDDIKDNYKVSWLISRRVKVLRSVLEKIGGVLLNVRLGRYGNFICRLFITTTSVPPLSRAVLFPWWVPLSGMGSLLNFGISIEPCHLRFFLNLRLLFLAVLESGAPLSSSLEEALYKCSVWMNEWTIPWGEVGLLIKTNSFSKQSYYINSSSLCPFFSGPKTLLFDQDLTVLFDQDLAGSSPN